MIGNFHESLDCRNNIVKFFGAQNLLLIVAMEETQFVRFGTTVHALLASLHTSVAGGSLAFTSLEMNIIAKKNRKNEEIVIVSTNCISASALRWPSNL